MQWVSWSLGTTRLLVKAKFHLSFNMTTALEQHPRSLSHHKGATCRVCSGDQLYHPVLCHCQLGQDIPIQWSTTIRQSWMSLNWSSTELRCWFSMICCVKLGTCHLIKVVQFESCTWWRWSFFQNCDSLAPAYMMKSTGAVPTWPRRAALHPPDVPGCLLLK